MGRISKRLWLVNPLVPIRRIGEKNGTKRSLLVDEHGVPLSLVVSGANRHDSISLDPLLKERARQDDGAIRNLCLDAGYVGKEEVVRENGFIPHIRPRGEEKELIKRDPTFKPRRWVVELSHSWFNRFRKLAPRYEKTDLSYVAFTLLAAAMITLNKIVVIYG
jgi:transposase